MKEHRPCPFCGMNVGSPNWERHADDCYFTLDKHFRLVSNEMSCTEADDYIDKVLLPAWNRRATESVEVVRCRDCRSAKTPSVMTQRYGTPGAVLCGNAFSKCTRRIMAPEDFCPYGKKKEKTDDS